MIAKFLACGFLPGGFLTSVVSIAIEAVHSPSFGEAASTATPPDPDQAPPSPGSGKVVRPAGVTVPGAGADIVDWRSQRGLVVDGRTYDFVVDRTSQAWWPGDDGEKGFWGRWGQHVTFDALPRRAGPRFPDYAAMFLTALADGDSRDLLDLDS
jgi:hypothetical protein